jgi:hydroxymethylpyrimidine pyrophosphatase-like HAD family hydrolase
MAGTATVAAAVRCLYADLDGTLLGPGASLLRGEGGSWSSLGIRALEACFRAEVEVVLFSGRRQQSVFEASRLIGSSAYIFELGCGLMLDGELEWLTGDFVPSPEAGTIYDQIDATGAPELLLEHFAGRLEYHTPWASGREVSHLFRGSVDLTEVDRMLTDAGITGLRLVDNGIIHEHAYRFPELEAVRAYHLVPAAASKARAAARHMQARGYAPADCVAVGDSHEDLNAAEAVGTFWLVANAVERDPTLPAVIRARSNVRVASEPYGGGVYEAVITTLAGG